jgi:UDP-3-O-[3-hydroxymyristoyl] glucosamine N-acyltransferase
MSTTNLRDVLLDEVERWSFQITEWELATVKAIARLSSVSVQRVQAARLEWMRMKPRQCHANARFMQENDPEGRTKQIVGWWTQNGNHVLHSVVRHRGQYLCFTPVDKILVPESTFRFRPDPKIEIRVEADRRNFYRDGVQIGPGVRQNPAQSIAYGEMLRQRLLSGVDPYEAVRLPMEIVANRQPE